MNINIVKRQLYKKYRLEGMDKYNAARKAGYSHHTALNAYRIERSEKDGIKKAFMKRGLTDEVLVDHALKGLEANKVISANVIAPDGEGMADAHGTTKDFIDVPDWAARHKYFNSICELTGRKDLKVKVEGEVQHNHFLHSIISKAIDVKDRLLNAV